MCSKFSLFLQTFIFALCAWHCLGALWQGQDEVEGLILSSWGWVSKLCSASHQTCSWWSEVVRTCWQKRRWGDWCFFFPSGSSVLPFLMFLWLWIPPPPFLLPPGSSFCLLLLACLKPLSAFSLWATVIHRVFTWAQWASSFQTILFFLYLDLVRLPVSSLSPLKFFFRSISALDTSVCQL